MDKENITQNEKKLLTALQNSQDDNKNEKTELEPSNEIVNLETDEIAKEVSKTSTENEIANEPE